MCRRICLLCQQTSLENMNMTPNCDVTNSAHQIQIAIIWHWMNPPHENFMRMPLARLNALQSAKCTTHHHDAVGYKHLRPAQGPNMGKCRPEKCRPPPPPPGGGQDHERAFAIHSVHQKCCTRHYPPPPPCWSLVLHCSYLLILNLSVILHICATLEGYCC